jgi:hypothetical protein
MSDGTSYAELEISLHLRGEDTYGVDIRLERPDTEDLGSTVEDAVAHFDFGALNDLMDLEQYDEYGKALAKALLASPEVRSRFDAATALEMPVQFRLVIAPAAEELHKLAWEALCNPDGDGVDLL